MTKNVSIGVLNSVAARATYEAMTTVQVSRGQKPWQNFEQYPALRGISTIAW